MKTIMQVWTWILRSLRDIGIAIRFLLAILLVCMAQIILGITIFNESLIFHDPGMVSAEVANLREWIAFAWLHSDKLTAAIYPFRSPVLKEELIYAALFVFPAFSVFLWPNGRKMHLGVLIILILIVMFDVSNLLEFNGYNSANGGYDGIGEMVCYSLHILFGAACVFVILVRLCWMGITHLSDRA
jgi:uncharacterized RDD family membrane protein YckC